jgi:aldehyde dehydrogenase (NAD+)
VAAKSGKFWAVRNPTDDSLVTDQVHCAGTEDVNDAVTAAKAAFKGPWAAFSGAERAKCMLKLADLLDENIESLMKLERIAMGQPKALVPLLGGVLAPIWRHFAGYCDKVPGQLVPEGSSQTYKMVRYDPFGVCAGIAAWNGALFILCMKIAPAVAAGNSFVFKSSEKSPLGTLALGELIVKAGFPPGVINLLSGAGETGALLASHMDVKKISYTGSVSSGRKVQIAATNSNLKRVDLELGGKSPSIIFKDADIENALVHSSQGFLANSGQICVAASRILVQEEIAEKFIEALTVRFKMYIHTLGDPELETTFLGPLADKAQAGRVISILDEGNRDGAEILIGGEFKGNYIQPTLIKNPSLESSIWRKEIFGPVLSIRIFKTEEEAIKLANNTEYGLSSCVFTSDIVRALRVSESLEAGWVSINSAQSLNYDLTFGGWKESGNGGREGGFASFMSNLQSKVISINMQISSK